MQLKDQAKFADIYMMYKYKWRDVNSNAVWRPYVPVDQISDHPFKIDYQTWYNLITTYLSILEEELFDGKTFRIPHKMGKIRMVRYRTLSYKSFENGNLVYKNTISSDNWRAMLVWFRMKESDMRYRFLYKLRFNRAANIRLGKLLKKNPEILYKYPEN